MTCVVGLSEKNKVYIGTDSAGVDDRQALTIRQDRKVFRTGDFIIGFTYSFRMGQLLAYSLKPPPRNPDDDVFAYMVTDFVSAVRECLQNGGCCETNNETASPVGMFLVGYAGRLFSIGADYQVGENSSGFDACGCGDLVALGALAVTEGEKPEKRIKDALAAAERFSAGVRGPFHIEVL